MSDTAQSWPGPVSWPIRAPQPVTDRSGDAVEGKPAADAAPEPVFSAFPPPPPNAPVVYHYEPHFASDPDLRAYLSNKFNVIAALFEHQEKLTMASFADMKAQTDALTANVDRFIAEAKAHADEQNAKLDALKAISDNGSEEEFQSAIDQIKAANDKLAAGVVSAPAPAPEPAPAPAEPTPPVAEPAPAPAEPAPAPAPDAAAPVPPDAVAEQPAPAPLPAETPGA